MTTRDFRGLLAAPLFAALFSCSSGGNQGMNEAGSADSDSMMNVDTQWVDTSGATKPVVTSEATDSGMNNKDTSFMKGPGKVPVPSP